MYRKMNTFTHLTEAQIVTKLKPCYATLTGSPCIYMHANFLIETANHY